MNMNAKENPKAIKATMHSLLEVEGAVLVMQSVEQAPDKKQRCVTTTYYDAAQKVIRQDQCIVVDEMPPLVGSLSELNPA